MINKRAQTVQGYLTPTKLLTSIIKQNKDKSLSKINKSTYSASRNTGENQDSTFIVDASNSAREHEKNSFVAQSNFSKPYFQNSLKKNEFKQQRNILPKQIKQTQNQKLKQSQHSIKSQQSGKKQNISHFNFADNQKRNNLSSIINDNKYFNLSRNNTDNTYVRQISDSRAPPKNPEIMTLQCYDLIRKLTKVKEGLQLEISQLQKLLDNTSKYLQNIDGQYQKIKQNILNYTSLSLDNAFKQYKQNMVQWGKYQDFQRKGLQMLRQISEYIENEQQSLNKKLSYNQTTAHSIDIQKRITHYSEVTQEIKNVREQCISMRPTINQEKIQAYERGLAVLCNF